MYVHLLSSKHSSKYRAGHVLRASITHMSWWGDPAKTSAPLLCGTLCVAALWGIAWPSLFFVSRLLSRSCLSGHFTATCCLSEFGQQKTK